MRSAVHNRYEDLYDRCDGPRRECGGPGAERAPLGEMFGAVKREAARGAGHSQGSCHRAQRGCACAGWRNCNADGPGGYLRDLRRALRSA